MIDEELLGYVALVHHLKQALAPVEDWEERAACAGLPRDWFFPSAGDDRQRYNRGLTVCASCSVRAECLDFARRTGQRGVWGGRVLDKDATLTKVLRIKRRDGRVIAIAVTGRKRR